MDTVKLKGNISLICMISTLLIPLSSQAAFSQEALKDEQGIILPIALEGGDDILPMTMGSKAGIFPTLAFTEKANPENGGVNVLAIDGGGIRGIISAMFLAELEKRLGCPLRFFFDEIIGTSTGGIIGLGLAAGYTAQELVDLYVNNGKKIFKSSIFRQGLTRAKYDHRGIESLLRTKFGTKTLSELSTNVTVTSYSLDDGKPYYFSSAEARNDSSHNWLLAYAARATSAAPTYFAPAETYSVADTNNTAPLYFIDGGVVINNPAVLAYSKAKRNLPEANDFLVLSLGTGEVDKNHKEHAQSGGALSWGIDLLDIMLGGVSKVNHDLMESFLGTKEVESRQYYRFQALISEELEPMDKTSSEHIAALVATGTKFVQDNEQEINDIVIKLKQTNRTSSRNSLQSDPEAAFCLAH
jgi:predicted acylesterase/phospholipase RssA